MNGYFLRFYLHENMQHGDMPAWEWLLQQANRLGAQGGSAFRSIAGFGRHHVLHQDHFLSVVGAITIAVDFLVTAAERQQLLELLARERMTLVYASWSARIGITGAAAPEQS